MFQFLLILFFLVYIILFYIEEYKKRKESPPGPWPIPVLGNLIQLAKASNLPHMAVANIATQYKEDLIRLKFGSQETLLISSYEVLKELSNHPDAIGRFLTGFLDDRNGGKKLGVIFSEGKFWERKRLWVFKTLQKLGFNKSLILESNTYEALQELFKEIDDQLSSGDKTLHIYQIFLFSVFKIMWKLLVGRLTEKDKVVIRRLLHKSELMCKTGTFGPGLLTIFPVLKHILPQLTGLNIHVDFSQDCKKAGRELIQEAISNIKNESNKPPESLTEAYATKMMRQPNSEDFFEEDFEIVFMDVLQASSDTISAFLEAAILFSVVYPSEQEKVYKEIQNCIPESEPPTYSHLKKMIYTQAFMTEVHRLTNIVPLYVNKRATKDFCYRGYFIKENTNIITNVYGILNNKAVMGEDTDRFRPQRFIKEDGKLGDNSSNVLPYSIGKRQCPGMAYAEVVGFLFLVNILRRYKLSTVPGKPPPTSEMYSGLTSKPYPFEVCIEKRP